MVFDAGEMAALVASLRARGQQVPIEVVARAGGRLWPDLRAPARHGAARDRGGGGPGAGAPSRDLVGGLSRHGRGKRDPRRHLLLRTRAAGGGGGEARHLSRPAAAIAALFSSASPAKRSKIGSFVRVHEALGHALRYPAAIPERLGLALAAALDRDGQAAARLARALDAAMPTDSGAERAVLEKALSEGRKQALNRRTGSKTRARSSRA
jgi:ParB family chromosome partitioning protein